MGFLGKALPGKKKARKRYRPAAKKKALHSGKAGFLKRLDRLIADLTSLVEATPGNRKFTYQFRLQQALSVRDRVKRSGSRPRSPGKTIYLVSPGSVRFVSGGAPGSKR